MNKDSLKAAEDAAKQFLEKAKILRQYESRTEGNWIFGSRHSGAVRRASMDLTRALSDLRKPG